MNDKKSLLIPKAYFLAFFCISLCFITNPSKGAEEPLESPYSQLVQYEFGTSRSVLIQIEQAVRNADEDQYKHIEAQLLTVLESPRATYAAKQFACRMLYQVGSQESVPPLARLLTDEQLSDMARYALQQIRGPQTDQVLLEMLDKVDPGLQIGIISSIADRRDIKAVDKLAQLASQGNVELARACITALGQIGGIEAAAALENIKEPDELKNIKADAMLMCADSMLTQSRGSQAKVIYDKLSGQDYPITIRAAAYRGIVQVEKENAAPLVIALLNDNNFELRQAAGTFIVEMPGSQATRAIADQLDALSPEIKVVVINALAVRGDKAAADQVAAQINADNDTVRLAAIEALAALGQARHVKNLTELSIQSGTLGKAALNSLSRMQGQDVTEVLVRIAQNGDPKVRVKVIDILAARQEIATVPLLFKMTDDDNSDIRKAVFRALGELASPSDVPRLVDLLIANNSTSERRILQQSLLMVARRSEEPDEVAAPVIKGLADMGFDPQADMAAKINLMAVLSRLAGDKALDAVRAQLNSPNKDIKKAAINALGNWPDPTPMNDLWQIAENDDNDTHRILALRGYIKLAALPSDRSYSQSTEIFARAMDSAQRPDEKRLILAALQNIPCFESLELARTCLQEAALKDEAQQLIDKFQTYSLIASASRVTTSFHAGDDQQAGVITAANDQIMPGDEPYGRIPFQSWWWRKSSREWLQYDFDKKAKISRVEIYWYDDSGVGINRMPQSWNLEYRNQNGQFQPVQDVSNYGTEMNKLNITTFTPVETDALRLNVKCRQFYTAGILEWRVF
ncbi:MAG: HEAT repeat domain-containing protein [Sedimentisphaerales bacterium]|nr:HEAT repeat domain-containing protein [Sedimentisphaerales bacterium]